MPALQDPDPPNAPRSRADLFWSFSWLALQGFGGVLAVVQRELVERKRWLTNAQFVEEWAVAQILPGPNVVNLALMIGGRYFGASGAFSALAGMLLLPMLAALALALAFGAVADLQSAQGALRGMGAVAAGLLTATGIKLMSALKINVMGLRLCLVLVTLSFIAIALLRVPMVWLVLGLGLLSCLWAWRCLGERAAAASGANPSPRN
ncbi:MAG: chromate transporter [Burkholderiaceae bacterium]|jgi:chromate transporter|nr:chromate transporter [Burkholderiaceae bacterium]